MISERPCDDLFNIWTPKKYQTISTITFFAAKGIVAIATVITDTFFWMHLLFYGLGAVNNLKWSNIRKMGNWK